MWRQSHRTSLVRVPRKRVPFRHGRGTRFCFPPGECYLQFMSKRRPISDSQRLKLREAMARRNANPNTRDGQKATRLITEQARVDLHDRLHDFLERLEGRLDNNPAMLGEVLELMRLLSLSKLGRNARLHRERDQQSIGEQIGKELGFL